MRLATVLRLSTLIALVAAAALWLAPAPFPQPPAEAEETVTVLVGNIWFCDESYQYPPTPCETVIDVGDTVVWDFTPAYLDDPDCVDCIHTATHCGDDCDDPTNDPLWDSGTLPYVAEDIFTYEFTFEQPGTFQYYCQIHPLVHRGRIVVQAAGGVAGDANCDETVNSIDAAYVLQYGAGLVSTVPCQDDADANEDGIINAIDAALILQYTAGLIDTLPPS